MNQLLRHTALLCAALIAIGCGSDKSDSSDAQKRDTDASTDAPAPATTKDKDAETSSSEDVKSGSADAKPAAKGCDPSCNEPATCDESEGEAHCKCPDGYDDVKGDGSQCESQAKSADSDKSECSADADCDKNARCESNKCVCRGPSFKGDGKSCECADGYEKAGNLCLALDGSKCGDDIDCSNSHCVGGICCAQACGSPGVECQTADGATCEDGKTCKYATAKDGSDCDDGNACTQGSVCKAGKCQVGAKPTNCDDSNPCTDDSCDTVIGCKNQNNTATCDDKNPCTQNDRCGNGHCASTTVLDCGAQADACNAGVCDPANGTCKKQPVADGKACDDADGCTKADQCSAGACKGGNACGPNATACNAGATNTCTCAPTFHEATGLCVPDNDECAANPCGANADCFDPSNAANDVTCTCKTAYKGDGHTCVLIEPCANNPCGDGRGTCTAGDNGTHTCTCAAGFLAVGDTCACDINGTFAVRSQLSLSWPANTPFESGSDSTYGWSIERHSYGKDGNLQLELISCGETNLDLCGQGVGALVPSEAYAQYVPVSIWGRAGAPTTQFTNAIAAPLPMGKFELPTHAMLQGISLADPLGAWPGSHKDVQGTTDFDGSAVNDARWIDSDNDSVFGLTTYTVGPNGVAADGSATAPITAYGPRSTVCPRSDPNATRLPYNYPPAAEGLTIRRVKRFFSANRVISALSGVINTCDNITGEITGPDNGHVHFDTRIGGCLRANGSDETQCSSTLVDFLDSNNDTANQVTANPFIMKRVADNITCDQVRALTF